MGNLIRILVADDSSVTRRIVTESISAEQDLEIVGAATDGNEAVAFFKAQSPDVVMLDVDMPNLNGIGALKAIRALNDSVPIIMFSTLTVKGGEATLDALSAGATDYAAKPTGVGHLDKAIQYLRSEVIPKLRTWGKRYKDRHEKKSAAPTITRETTPSIQSAPVATPAPAAPAPPISLRGSSSFTINTPRVTTPAMPSTTPRRRAGAVSVLAIGSSTGGPNALAELIGLLPGDLGVPVVIVQHMPPVFTQLLAERLDRGSRLKVREGMDGAPLRANEVWIAPGDFHMTVSREGTDTLIRTNQQAPENSCRPAVDVLFRSVANVYGNQALAAVLTGMGRDGTAGCQVLQKCGATIYAQDEASSVVWGMPRSVAEAGLADSVLNLKDMAAAIVTRIRGSQGALVNA